jgi:CheY-like chemotaxis protein
MTPSPPLPTELVASQAEAAPVRSIHVVDADLATFDLMREWLEPDGWRVVELESGKLGAGGHDGADGDKADAPSLVIVDLAYPRHAALPALARLREALPGVPLLVMSPTIFDGVGCCGPCARQLGVAGVLPKPLSREALVAAVANVALLG